jgi:predicted dehydrogenase
LFVAKQLGAAILGTGWVSGEYIKAFKKNPHTDVVAILSRQIERGESKAAAHGLPDCRAYTDLRELLRDDAVDIIAVCTPNHLHAGQGIAAARAGKHVIVEKPAAIDLRSLHRLDAAIRDAGVRSIVSFVLRWNPMFENVKAMLAQGLVGDLFYAEVDYMHAIDASKRPYAWINTTAHGGSALLTGGCHAVDGLRWFVQDEAVEVSAYSSRSKKNELRFEFDPNIVTIVRFAKGAIGKVGCVLESHMPYLYHVALFGDRGTIRNNRLFTKTWPGQNDWAEIPAIMPDSAEVTHHPFQGEVDHFVGCIRGGKESHCSVADAVKTHEICLAADRAAATGKLVRLPLRKP